MTKINRSNGGRERTEINAVWWVRADAYAQERGFPCATEIEVRFVHGDGEPHIVDAGIDYCFIVFQN